MSESETLFPFRDRSARRGYIDAQGNVVISPRYLAVGTGEFSDDRALVYSDENSASVGYGYIDPQGQLATAFRFKSAHPYSGGRAWVRVDNRWAIIDCQGRELCPFQYWAEQSSGFHAVNRWLDHADDRTQPLANSSSGYAHGYLNRDGQVAVPFVFEWAGAFDEQRAPVRRQNKYGYLDLDGQLVIDHQFQRFTRFSEGMAGVVLADSQNAVIDLGGEVIFEHEFESTPRFRQGRARVESDGYFGYIDPRGSTAIPCDYEGASDFFISDVAFVRQNEAWILIDRDGRQRGSETFDEYHDRGSFGDELLCVARNERWGFIDTRGQFVIEPRFTDSAWFRHGLAYVAEETDAGLLTGYINARGEYLWSLQF